MTGIRKKNSGIDGQKMRKLAYKLKKEIPGLGFALVVFDFENDVKLGNYISNVKDDFMAKALQKQLDALKEGKTFPTPES